jgi:hypothetical protein
LQGAFTWANLDQVNIYLLTEVKVQTSSRCGLYDSRTISIHPRGYAQLICLTMLLDRSHPSHRPQLRFRNSQAPWRWEVQASPHSDILTCFEMHISQVQRALLHPHPNGRVKNHKHSGRAAFESQHVLDKVDKPQSVIHSHPTPCPDKLSSNKISLMQCH